jgi:hypothetical protein
MVSQHVKHVRIAGRHFEMVRLLFVVRSRHGFCSCSHESEPIRDRGSRERAVLEFKTLKALIQ